MTFNYEINPTPNRLGLYGIFLRITENRKHRRIKTGIELRSVADWNPKKQRVRTSEPRHGKYNDILDKFIHEAKITFTDMRDTGTATADKVILQLSGKVKPESFLLYLDKQTEIKESAGKMNSRGRFKLLRSYLNKYISSKGRIYTDLQFADITPQFLSDFETFMRSRTKDTDPTKRLSDATIIGMLGLIRTLIKKAIRIDRIIKPENDPFVYYPIKSISSTKEKMTADEIRLIEDVEIIEESTDDVRNLFLFAFYCAGMRFSDCILLRWSDISPDGRLHYKMMKTGKVQDIQIVEQAEKILNLYRHDEVGENDFIFPFIDPTKDYAKAMNEDERQLLPADVRKKLYGRLSDLNAYANKKLRIIAKRAGINKKITFHVARHSFARVAKQRGADNLMLKNLLAHSSLSTTERYMGSFDTDEKDFAIHGIFDTSNYIREDLIKAIRTLPADKLHLLKKVVDDIVK